MIFITLLDIKPGLDEEAYGVLEGLRGEGGIPGFPWESTMLGLAAGLSVLLLLWRKQHRRP